MPYRRRPRRAKRKPRIYGTKAKFMPKRLALERKGQVSTKTFYFKTAGTLNSTNLTGVTFGRWATQFNPVIPTNPNRLPVVSDSTTIAECYTEYKVLAVKVRLFAANVGTEFGQIQPGPDFPGYNRGNTVVYIDQEIRENEPQYANIVDVINLGSAKMIPSRASKFTMTMYRKKGVPEWGCCDRTVPAADRSPDPWYGAIFLLGNNARLTPSVNPLWYYTVTYKIIFRGRAYTP